MSQAVTKIPKKQVSIVISRNSVLRLRGRYVFFVLDCYSTRNLDIFNPAKPSCVVNSVVFELQKLLTSLLRLKMGESHTRFQFLSLVVFLELKDG